ncbi:MAG: magnesium chelatase subunit H [Ardenticatenaceae bacterium]|nr:magnesium chelatase subunit H [Ardenticatenaceae bacterium]
MRALHFVYITMDGLHNAALREAATMLHQEHGVQMNLHLYQTSAMRSPDDWARLERDVQQADFIFGCMIFGEEHVRPLQTLLQSVETPTCMITSNPALIYCTRLGKFVLSQPKDEEPGLISRWMQKLRPKKNGRSEGHRQTALLKNLTKLMKYVPGKVRDLHTFIAMHDYWLHSSPENLMRMMVLLIDRYVPDFAGQLPVLDAIAYPDAAIYHPDAPEPFPDIASYQKWRKEQGMPVAGHFVGAPNGNGAWKGAVGVLTMRAIILTGNTAHIDTIIRKIESQGIEARAAYSSLMDFRPSIDQYFAAEGEGKTTVPNSDLPPVDLLVNTIGFPLVGGPAGARPEEAIQKLDELNVGYFDMVPLSFQRIEDWQKDEIGLTPMQVAMNIALPELDGIAEPVIFGGPTMTQEKFIANEQELEMAAKRIAKRVRLRHKANADKRIAVVLFNFPPNLGNAGTAAFLDVFESVTTLLKEMQAAGYTVELPESAEALRKQVVEGNAMRYGTDGNVAAQLPLNEYRDRFPWYTEIEKYWGYAPGELLTDGRNFHILGAEFGNVFIGIQPSFGYERDPMRLLMGKDASPHHGFAAFYTWLDQIYDADAVVHFGTHGALEFMPGKQTGVSAQCWPPRLLGSLPNFYYYCVNNPSEGSIAKRRGAATLVSYMVPPLQQAGLYKGLRRLKDSLDNYHSRPDAELLTDIRTQADKLGIVVNGVYAQANGLTNGVNGHTNGSANGHTNSHLSDSAYVAALGHELIQVEHRMIPLGLHVLGRAPVDAELIDMLALVVAFNPTKHPKRDEKLPTLPVLIARGLGWDFEQLQQSLKIDTLAQDRWDQIENILHETMRLFVEAPRQPELDIREVETYLQETARIPKGLLANLWPWLDDLLSRIVHDEEVAGMLRSLDGGYVLPSPGNDVMRNDKIVPTGRNIHALDPFRVPSPLAVANGKKLVEQMLERLTVESGQLPETVAMVLWGTDNLKSDGEGIAQCFELLGARPIEDELGNIADVALIPLAEMSRPRIDVIMTLSGIFRDIFHHQAGLLDKAVRLAAEADEPLQQNFVRKHTLAHAAELGVDMSEAACRVFSNAPGSYGANVNHLVESSTWDDDDQLSDTFLSRKSYAFTPSGEWRGARQVMERSLATVDATFQNIDSFELGISDVDHYYEYLGGVAKSVEKLRGKRPSVMVADAIAMDDRLSSLEQMVRLESRAKLLNPKWHDSMLNHGYEGVREIEIRVSNTYGWSATADAVEGWVYDDIAETFLLDEEMRARMAKANAHATAGIARRLLEAEARGFWDASDEMIEELREIYGNLEDQLEGIYA